ncbi:MAG: MotA/TolQ/ExbB proton channel family protein [Deltaproteobacteria bacterium]|nr:MotA/TolQ/ExbB proton channel family protein [Deltaproteobacteria bacterium]
MEMIHSQNIVTQVTVQAALQGAAGWVMWFLVALSIISLTIAVERLIFYAINRGDVGTVQSALNRLMASGKVDEAKALLKRQRGLAAKVVGEGLEASDRGRVAVDEVMRGVAKAERLRYERGLAVLATLGNNAPFVGLFGTVLEIIRSLHILSVKSGVAAGAVMSSLSEALAATAIGLLVALPAVAMHNYFQRRLKLFSTEAEALGNVLLAHLSEGERRAAAGDGAAAVAAGAAAPTTATATAAAGS